VLRLKQKPTVKLNWPPLRKLRKMPKPKPKRKSYAVLPKKKRTRRLQKWSVYV
jgi:hypothetical protein